MTQLSEIERLAEYFEAKAKTARKTECSPEYQAYWRGYAECAAECAESLRSRSTETHNG